MSTGTASSPAAIGGRYVPERDNFYCGSCRSFVQAPKGQGLRACPTPRCTRPTGFGVFVAVPRPGASHLRA